MASAYVRKGVLRAYLSLSRCLSIASYLGRMQPISCTLLPVSVASLGFLRTFQILSPHTDSLLDDSNLIVLFPSSL